ncbi:MAG TPA: hypothetical protein VFG97_09275, partial [Pedococcus sp.]|nr:hypothetical protein [Pedococcus sp.]
MNQAPVLGESEELPAAAGTPADEHGPPHAVAAEQMTPGGVLTRRSGSAPFEVHLDVYTGPFDL